MIIETFYFNLGSAANADDVRIAAVAEKLKSQPATATVIGHTCDTPIVSAEAKKLFGTNEKLAEERAKLILEKLKSAGVATPMLLISRGEMAPVSTNKSINRRVEIHLD